MFPKVSNSIVALKNVIIQFIPKKVGSALKYIVYFPMDTLDLLLDRRDELIPPTKMREISCVSGSVKISGGKHLQHVERRGESPWILPYQSR